MTFAQELMNEAEEAVANRSRTFGHKFKTMAWYTGRKQMRGAPRKALSAALGLIPVPMLGPAIDMGMQKAINKIKGDSHRSKRAAYGAAAITIGNLESLRKAAKFDAKDQKTLAEKIDGNLLKLRDASTELQRASMDFVQAQAAGDVPSRDQMWRLLYALYDRRRYEQKLTILVGAMRERLDTIDEYVGATAKKTTELEADIEDALDALEPLLAPALQAPRSPAAYGRL